MKQEQTSFFLWNLLKSTSYNRDVKESEVHWTCHPQLSFVDTWQLCAIPISCESSWHWLDWAGSCMADCIYANWEWKINPLSTPLLYDAGDTCNVWRNWWRTNMGFWWCHIQENGRLDEREFLPTAWFLRWNVCIFNSDQSLSRMRIVRFAWAVTLPTALQCTSMEKGYRSDTWLVHTNIRSMIHVYVPRDSLQTKQRIVTCHP